MDKPKRYILLACAVLYRECYYCAAVSKNIIDIKLLEKGLHDIGAPKMSAKLQEEINNIKTEDYDAILLAYGLCNNGTMGLSSKIPVVLPRAHDCITLLMGSKEKYKEYFSQNTGTYYKSSGWIEREISAVYNSQSTISQMGISNYQEYVDKYGEENAKYLMETLGMMAHYDKLAYIDTGVGDFKHYQERVKKEASDKGWKYEELKGNLDLIRRLVDGAWDDQDFLVIPPGHTGKPSYDDGVVKFKKNKKFNHEGHEEKK